MLRTLVESKPRKIRRTTGTIVSFLAHYGLVLFAIYTSAEAETLDDGPKQERVEFVEAREEAPPQRKEPLPPELLAAPLPVKALQMLLAPLEIPSVLPDVDLSKGGTDPDAFARMRPLTSDSAGAPAPLKPHG